MKYNAVAFLEGLFQHPGGTAAGDGPVAGADALPSASADVAVTGTTLPPEWHLLWDERAAIMECEGGLPREQAEAAALAEITERIRRGERLDTECACPACRGRNDACN